MLYSSSEYRLLLGVTGHIDATERPIMSNDKPTAMHRRLYIRYYTCDIRKEIDKAFAAKKFTKKPIGPLGHYIKLKNNEIALSLETHLKNLMYAFTFDTWEDMEVLSCIMRRSFPSVKPPQMIIRRFTKRLDISRFKTKVLNSILPMYRVLMLMLMAWMILSPILYVTPG